MVIYLIIIGAAAGFLATRLMGYEMDVLRAVGIGIAGALVGGFVVRFIGSMLGMVGGLVGAIAGAVLLIWLWQTYVQK